MKRLALMAVAMFLMTAFGQMARGQSNATSASLSDGDIVSMVKAGLSADVIIAKVQTSACNFDTSPAALEKLKAAGVPDSVILSMVKNPASNSSESKPNTNTLQNEPLQNEPKASQRTKSLGSKRPVADKANNSKPVLLIIGNGVQNRHGKIDKHWLKEFSKAKGCFETVTDSSAPHNYELIVTEQKKSAFVTIMASQQPTFEATLTGPKGKYAASQTISPKLFGHNHYPWSRARAFAESQICGSRASEVGSSQEAP